MKMVNYGELHNKSMGFIQVDDLNLLDMNVYDTINSKELKKLKLKKCIYFIVDSTCENVPEQTAIQIYSNGSNKVYVKLISLYDNGDLYSKIFIVPAEDEIVSSLQKLYEDYKKYLLENVDEAKDSVNELRICHSGYSDTKYTMGERKFFSEEAKIIINNLQKLGIKQ